MAEFQTVMAQAARMCSSHKLCTSCLIEKNRVVSCRAFMFEHPDEFEEIITQWAEEHPLVTNGAKKQLEEAEKNFQKRKIGDVGKLRSLRAAGWPLKKLAEEFGCSEATVYNTMKREGIE